MKKICTLLFFAANAALAQSVIIDPSADPTVTTNIIKTATDKYGLEHTDGTVRINTFLNNDPMSIFWGGWVQTASAHPLILSTDNAGAQVYLNPNGNIILNPSNGKPGNVGIGLQRASSPAEKLTVGGNIRASSLAGTGSRPVYANLNGTLTTTAPVQTYSVIVSPQAFQKRISDAAGILVSTASYHDAAVTGTGTSISDELCAPVTLPVGATITQMQVYFIDSEPSSNLRFLLYRSAVDDINGALLVTLFQNTANPASPVTISSVTSGTLSEVVTDKKYFYILVDPVNTTNTGAGTWTTSNRMTIKGVKITYTL